MVEKRPILVCDDDDMIVRIVTSKLASVGYQVVTASSGAEALKIIGAFPPSLLILDAVMPGLSGFDVLEAIGASQKAVSFGILMLTSRRGQEDVARAISSGADDYLIKPFSLANLVARVERLLEPPADPDSAWL